MNQKNLIEKLKQNVERHGVSEGSESSRTWKVQIFCQRKRDVHHERGQFCILASCCLSSVRRNSVLEELRVSRLAVSSSKKRFVVEHSGGKRCYSEDRVGKREEKLSA